MSKVVLESSTPKPDTNALATGRFLRQRPSFITTAASTTPGSSTPASIHSYPPRPLTKTPWNRSQARTRPYCYPPQPLPEKTDKMVMAIPDTDTVAASENHRTFSGAKSLAAADGDLASIFEYANPLVPFLVPPLSTPPLVGARETEGSERNTVADYGFRDPRISPLLASRIAKLLFSVCAVIIAASIVLISSRPVSLRILAGLEEVSVVFRYTIIQAPVRMGFVSPVDCAIAREGARVVAEWSSPGPKESRSWLSRTMLGSTVVPADAVLDPHLPHWSFHGQNGHITFELHRNATIITVVIESDFPESIPRDIRIWTFVPESKQGPRHSRSPDTPIFPYQSEDRGLFPLLLGDVIFQEGSTPRERKYHVPHGRHAYTPIGMVMLEFLSNGDGNFTRIRFVRILGIPS